MVTRKYAKKGEGGVEVLVEAVASSSYLVG